MSFSLSRALSSVPIERAAFAVTELGAESGLAYPAARNRAMLHYVLRGEAVLRHPAIGEQRLGPGDFVAVPWGDGHAIGGGAARAFRSTSILKDLLPAEEPMRIDAAGGGAIGAVLLSGSIDMRHSTGQHARAALPEIIVLRPGTGKHASFVPPDIMPAALTGIGANAFAASFMHMLLTQAVRGSLVETPLGEPDKLDLMHFPKVASVHRLMERHLEESWTIERLADAAGMARSTFIAKFTEAAGEPPLTRLAKIRLRHADKLLGGLRPISEIAHMVGYVSHASFSRAFFREFGETPTQRRQRSRASDSAAA